MLFGSKDPEFAEFLRHEAVAGASRFSARNFLLDEGVTQRRADEYLANVRDYLDSKKLLSLSTLPDWIGAHEEYLKKHILLDRPASYLSSGNLDPADAASCPETFRSADSLAAYGGAELSLHVVRLIELRPLLSHPNAPPNDPDAFFESARRCAEVWPDIVRAPDADVLAVNGVLEAWNGKADLRPVFVGFFAEHKTLFDKIFAGNWADELRDRMGLCHLGHYRPQRVLLFRYPLQRVPSLKGWRLPRPLVVPTVLDGRHNEAFCPAPPRETCGRLVDLQGRGVEPFREVLHPHLDLKAEFLFRVGEITGAPPADLSRARQSHIEHMRTHHHHPGFARETDP